MFTTLASRTTMNWAMQAITSTSHLLVTPAGGLSTTMAVGVRASVMGAPGMDSALELNWTCRSAYDNTSGPPGPVVCGQDHLNHPGAHLAAARQHGGGGGQPASIRGVRNESEEKRLRRPKGGAEGN